MTEPLGVKTQAQKDKIEKEKDKTTVLVPQIHDTDVGILRFWLQRAKAIVAVAALPAVKGTMVAIESYFNFDIPLEVELTIITLVTGIFVHQVPNAK